MFEYFAADHLLLIFGMALVTYVSRVLPLFLLSSRDLNPLFLRWLEMVPPAVLAALLAPELFLRSAAEGGKELFITPGNVFLLASIPTFAVGWFTRNFFVTIAVGMGLVALMRYLESP